MGTNAFFIFTRNTPFVQHSTAVDVRSLLRLPVDEVAQLDPKKFPQFEIYVETNSRNQVVKSGVLFLYQIFPGKPKIR